MKKALLICVAVLLLSIHPQDARAQWLGNVYVPYESEEEGIRFDFPAGWLEISARVLEDQETMLTIREKTGMRADEVMALLESAPLVLYDVSREEADYTPNLSLVTAELEAADQAYMQNELDPEAMRESLQTQFGAMYTDFEWILVPEIRQMGGTYLLCCISSYEMEGMRIKSYHATTANDGTMYFFVYSALEEMMDEKAIDTVEVLLSSISFYPPGE